MKATLQSFVAATLTLSSAQTVPAAYAAASVTSPPRANVSAGAEDTSIRPFRINIPDEKLTELRALMAET